MSLGVDAEKLRAAMPRASEAFLRLNGLLPPSTEASPKLARSSCDDADSGKGGVPTLKLRAHASVVISSTTPNPLSTPKTKRSASSKPRATRVPRTRNAETWTEAQFWQRIRSCLRRMSIYWRPARLALQSARVPHKGPRGQKWAFLCCDCRHLFPRTRVQLDHDIPCGALTAYEHIGPFLQRLLSEDTRAYKVRCLSCHQSKTNLERESKSSAFAKK